MRRIGKEDRLEGEEEGGQVTQARSAPSRLRVRNNMTIGDKEDDKMVNVIVGDQ